MIENIQKVLNTMQYTDYEDNALENDGVLGDKTISAWNEFIEDKGVSNYIGNVYSYYNATPEVASNLYGALDYSSNYADNLDFSIDKNYTGEVSSYLENQGYINPSSVETNTTYNNMPYLEVETNLSAEVPEWFSDSVFAIGNVLESTQLYDTGGFFGVLDDISKVASIGGKAISSIGILVTAFDIGSAIVDKDMEQILVSVGGAAFGAIGAVAGASIAGAGSGGSLAVVGGVMGAVAGAEFGEMAGKWVYDMATK